MSIDCDGDQSFCFLVLMRDKIITSNDLTATAGLPTALYTYLSAQ